VALLSEDAIEGSLTLGVVCSLAQGGEEGHLGETDISVLSSKTQSRPPADRLVDRCSVVHQAAHQHTLRRAKEENKTGYYMSTVPWFRWEPGSSYLSV
jgi:hypothetical protein